ncbi:MAG TPA: glycosyltransferase, partial [Acidobacteriota bacterium]
KRFFAPVEMSYIRWWKISEALARLGHEVDMATNEPDGMFRSKRTAVEMSSHLRRIPLSSVRWKDYDVIKTLFHSGFQTLEERAGLDHSFIISKLGSVVGPVDHEGIHFFGKVRRRLYSIQKKINLRSKYITLLSAPAISLWESCFGRTENLLLVPGAADREVPHPRSDPYPKDGWKKCLFAGNIYIKQTQKKANEVLVQKLNLLGKHLLERRIRLYMTGTGDARKLDHRFVRFLASVAYDQTWNHFYFADVGVVVASGKFLHNNESSKIYHYLRAGLPVVCEQGFPNEQIIREAQLGFIAENGNINAMVNAIEQAACKKDWDRNYAVQYILDHHTWDHRAAIYDRLIREDR